MFTWVLLQLFLTFSISIGQRLSLFAAKCDLAYNLDVWIFFH